jgi:phage protein D
VFNYLSVSFPLAQNPPKRVVAFNLMQNRYAHEIATVRFRDWNVQLNDIKPTDPVKCILRGKDSSREFVGYIHDIKPEITPSNRSVTVTLIGASYVLKQAKQRVFENVTADAVVKKIASEYGFSAYTDPHPRVYEQVAQAGHSELQIMARLARQCGYTLRVENTSIYFKKLTSDFQALKSSASSFIMRDSNNPRGSTLYSFALTMGESIEYADAYKSAPRVGGVDPRTLNSNLVTNQIRPEAIRQKSSAELFDSFATEIVAPSYDVAYYESEALDQKNRFPYRASIKVLGTPTLGPDKPIFLDGIGLDYSGYWIILSARHEIVETSSNVLQYTTILEVGSDSLGQAKVFNDLAIFTPDELKLRQLQTGYRNVYDSGASVISVNNNSVDLSNSKIVDIGNRKLPNVIKPSNTYKWVAQNPAISEATIDAKNRNDAVFQRLGM